MRFAWLGMAVLLLAACGDDDADAGTDAGTLGDGGLDAGADAGFDAGPGEPDGGMDAGSDAGPPEGFVALDPCEAGPDRQTVDVARDGSLVAYVTCGDEGAGVWVRGLSDDAEPVSIADAEATWSVELAPDDAHVVYGAEGAFWVRRVDGSAEAVALSDGTVETHRLFLSKVSDTAFAARIVLVEETAGGTRRAVVRGAEDDYATATVLLEGDGVVADVSLLSVSGRTFIAIVDDAGTEHYVNVRVDGTELAAPFSFGPEAKGMAPVGLGDTHAVLLTGDRLERIVWREGEELIELAPSGVLMDQAHLYVAEMGRGNKYVHFIQDGNPSRRIREGTDPIEVLATADATGQTVSPNEDWVVYVSEAEVFAVPADGSADPVALAEVGAPSPFTAVYRPDSAEVAVVTESGGLVTAPIAEAEMSIELESSGVVEGSVRWGGDGSQILWLHEDGGARTLRVAAADGGTPSTGAEDVTWYWTVPTTAGVIVVQDGMLLHLTP